MLATYQIDTLDLKKNPLGDAGARILAEGIRKSRSLVHVDLSSSEMGREGADALFSEMCDNCTVTCLYVGNTKGLHRNFLNGTAVSRLNTVLQRHQLMVLLDLGGASIGDEGLALIRDGVVKSLTLRILNLSFNVISSASDKVLIDIMGRSGVRRLDLSQNPLGDQFKFDLDASTKSRLFFQTHLNLSRCEFSGCGAMMLLDACKKDTCLNTFTLEECKIVPEELPFLRSFVSGNSALQIFSLKSCGFGNPGVEALAEGMAKNFCLLELYLCGNRISVLRRE